MSDQFDFFKITKEDKESLSDFLLPIAGKKYSLTVTKVDVSKDNDGSGLVKVMCVDSESKKIMTLWMKSNNSFGKRKWISLIDSLISEQEMVNFTPVSLVGKSFNAIGESREYNGKTYHDLGKFSKNSSQSSSVSPDEIPF